MRKKEREEKGKKGFEANLKEEKERKGKVRGSRNEGVKKVEDKEDDKLDIG